MTPGALQLRQSKPASAKAANDGSVGADLIEIEAAECQSSVIAAARAVGLEIMGYTESNDPSIFLRYVEAGLDYINHDYLDVALSVLEKPL